MNNMKPEKLLDIPLDTALWMGEAVLWVTEHFVPPTAHYELKPAVITIFENDELELPPEAA